MSTSDLLGLCPDYIGVSWTGESIRLRPDGMMIRGEALHTRTSLLRLLHYWWPLALGWSLTVVVGRASGRTPTMAGVATLLFGITAAYSLDRVVDPVADLAATPAGMWLRRTLIGVAIVSSVLCGIAALHLDVRTAALVPALGGAAMLYPRLKQLPLTKTVALPLVWTWAAIALPFNDGSWLGWHAVRFPVALPLLLLIGAGCLLCDLKDEEADRLTGVRSLPALVGGAATVRIAIALAVSAAALGWMEHRTGIIVSAAALAVATMVPALLASDAAGPLLVDVILTLPGILISARVV
jgi:4-hydroxybenzoate polyprenyltransferase